MVRRGTIISVTTSWKDQRLKLTCTMAALLLSFGAGRFIRHSRSMMTIEPAPADAAAVVR
jgi:hypothetical protein